ncbi:protein kinase [Azospirillum sp. TSH100]|uniref:protein kinase domain-containing protein n=1 Tax=Azospirillum sp. TSH100 TaxID=652764 RepID=UPI00145B1745|nr:protein kinase [Azospirillum sp. TSH100]
MGVDEAQPDRILISQKGKYEMTNYSFSASNLKKIYGQKFYANNMAGGGNITFSIHNESNARPRTGLEAYGILVSCHHPSLGDLPSFLKIFKVDIPERRERTEFLIQSGLTKSHEWLFQGVPYAWLPGSTINSHTIIGHVALQIGGRFGGCAEDFSRLKEQGAWNGTYDPKLRKTFAAQLCCAVAALESMQIVHGDLSAANIMIGPGPKGERVCSLCDFDGFYHPSIQPLPRTVGGIACRPLGTTGYQYPEILNRIAADPGAKDGSILVQTDRFALGAIICELMTWSPDAEALLDRHELLTPEMVRAQSISELPDRIVQLWPKGFRLLERALKAGSIADMPSPEDWLEALGIGVRLHKEFQNRPFFEFHKRSGTRTKLVQKVQLSMSDTGNFASVSSELSEIGYQFSGKKLLLKVGWGHPLFLIQDGRSHSLGDGPQDVPLNPADSLISNFWEIRAFDGQPSG